MIKRFAITLGIIILSVPSVNAQTYEKCIVTDFEHWGSPNAVLYGVPDYFSANTIWTSELKLKASQLLKQKFNIDQVSFLNDAIRVKNDLEPDKNYYLDTINRSSADLFVLISSYVSPYNILSIEVEVEDRTEKKKYKNKTRMKLVPITNKEGLDLGIIVGATDFQDAYEEVLEAVILSKKKWLTEKEVMRVHSNDYPDFLKNTIQLNIPFVSFHEQTYTLDFLNSRPDDSIQFEHKDLIKKVKNRLIYKKTETNGHQVIKSSLLKSNWEVFYTEKKTIVEGQKFSFNVSKEYPKAIIMSEYDTLGLINLFEANTLSANIGTDSISISSVAYNSLEEIYLNNKLTGLIQLPDYNPAKKSFIKLFIHQDLQDEELGSFISLFILNRKLRRL